MEIAVKDVIFRLSLAILIGGVIGYEREINHRAAGFRTHILVCIGATLISIIQIDIGNKAIEIIGTYKELINVIKVDYGRLGAQAISGIGFLGAGTILHNKGNIKGLTTAASLWVVACLGLAIGMGDYSTSIIAFIFIVIILVLFKCIEEKFIYKANEKKLQVKYYKKHNVQLHIEEVFEKNSIIIKSIEFLQIDENNKENEKFKVVLVMYTIIKPKYLELNKVLNNISENDSIIMVREEDTNG